MEIKKAYHFGEHLKSVRKEIGISQQTLSRISNVTRTIISNIETGKIKNPHLKTILKLSKELNLELHLTTNYLKNAY